VKQKNPEYNEGRRLFAKKKPIEERRCFFASVYCYFCGFSADAASDQGDPDAHQKETGLWSGADDHRCCAGFDRRPFGGNDRRLLYQDLHQLLHRTDHYCHRGGGRSGCAAQALRLPRQDRFGAGDFDPCQKGDHDGPARSDGSFERSRRRLSVGTLCGQDRRRDGDALGTESGCEPVLPPHCHVFDALYHQYAVYPHRHPRDQHLPADRAESGLCHRDADRFLLFVSAQMQSGESAVGQRQEKSGAGSFILSLAHLHGGAVQRPLQPAHVSVGGAEHPFDVFPHRKREKRIFPRCL